MPPADRNLLESAAPGREWCRVPSEQTLGRQRLRAARSCVEHHLDDALDIAVSRCHSAAVHAEPPRDPLPDILAIEFFTLNFSGAKYIRQGGELGLAPQIEAERLRSPEQMALFAGHSCKRGREATARFPPIVPTPVTFFPPR